MHDVCILIHYSLYKHYKKRLLNTWENLTSITLTFDTKWNKAMKKYLYML